MPLPPNHIDLNGIPAEILMERFIHELEVFESWFTPYTNKDLILKVFNSLFHRKYMRTSINGKSRWELEEQSYF